MKTAGTLLVAALLFCNPVIGAGVEVFGFGGIENGKEFDPGIACQAYPCPILGTIEMGKRARLLDRHARHLFRFFW